MAETTDGVTIGGLRMLTVEGPTLRRSQYRFDVVDGSAARVRSRMYEAVPGETGIAGRVEKHQVPFIAANIALTSAMDLEDLLDAGPTLRVVGVGSNGLTYTLGDEAWLVEDPERAIGAGTAPVRFESKLDGKVDGIRRSAS